MTSIICPTCGKPGLEVPIKCGASSTDPVLGGAVHCDAPAHHDGPHWAWTRDGAKTAWKRA